LARPRLQHMEVLDLGGAVAVDVLKTWIGQGGAGEGPVFWGARGPSGALNSRGTSTAAPADPAPSAAVGGRSAGASAPSLAPPLRDAVSGASPAASTGAGPVEFCGFLRLLNGFLRVLRGAAGAADPMDPAAGSARGSGGRLGRSADSATGSAWQDLHVALSAQARRPGSHAQLFGQEAAAAGRRVPAPGGPCRPVLYEGRAQSRCGHQAFPGSGLGRPPVFRPAGAMASVRAARGPARTGRAVRRRRRGAPRAGTVPGGGQTRSGGKRAPLVAQLMLALYSTGTTGPRRLENSTTAGRRLLAEELGVDSRRRAGPTRTMEDPAGGIRVAIRRPAGGRHRRPRAEPGRRVHRVSRASRRPGQKPAETRKKPQKTRRTQTGPRSSRTAGRRTQPETASAGGWRPAMEQDAPG